MTRYSLSAKILPVFLILSCWISAPSFSDEESRSIWRSERPKLELLGTVVGKRSGATAIVANDRSGKVALASVHDQIEGWNVARVDLGSVTLVKDGETLKLALTRKWPVGLIQRVNDQVSVVNASVLKEVLETHSLNGEWSKLRVSPKVEQGRISGWKIDALKEGSLLKEIGIREGDRILTVNGKSVASPQEGFSLIETLRKGWRENPRVEIQLERKGKPQTLVYLLN